MLRFLLILSLIMFVVFKLGGFFFRLAAGSNTNRNPQQASNRNSGNVNINRNPQQTSKNRDFKGGEYIDYEEIK